MLTGARLALLAALTAVAATVLPATASAGTYTVVQCSQAVNPNHQAVAENTSVYDLADGCASNDGLRIQHALLGDAPPGTYGRWTWRAPAGTVFTSIEASASLVDGSASEQARLWAVRPGGELLAFGAQGAAWEPADVLAGEFSEFRAQLECASSASCPSLGGGVAAVRDVRLRTEDRAAPAAELTGGSLFGSDAVRGSRRVSFRATDEGSGVRELELRVNGELAYSEVRDCQVGGGVATTLSPCPATAEASASFSTSSAPFATGVNDVAACGFDLALEGLPNRHCERRDVFVDDLCPASDVGAGNQLSARFAGGRKVIRKRSNRPARITGSLKTDSGAGVAGARICALTRVKLDGEPYKVADTARTRANGTYKLRLPPGASRKVFVDRVFGDEVLQRTGLAINSIVRPSFEVKPGKRVKVGKRLRFRGKLPGPGCDGRIVKVQAKIGKDRWQVFRNPRTNENCVYESRFKLRATSRATRYLFRARVPEQRNYPYLPGSSTVRARMAVPAKG